MKNTHILATVTTMLSAAAAAENGAGVIYEGRKTTYRELDDLSRRAAAGLASLGIGLGDRVAFWLPNTPAYLVLYFACVRLGARRRRQPTVSRWRGRRCPWPHWRESTANVARLPRHRLSRHLGGS